MAVVGVGAGVGACGAVEGSGSDGVGTALRVFGALEESVGAYEAEVGALAAAPLSVGPVVPPEGAGVVSGVRGSVSGLGRAFAGLCAAREACSGTAASFARLAVRDARARASLERAEDVLELEGSAFEAEAAAKRGDGAAAAAAVARFRGVSGRLCVPDGDRARVDAAAAAAAATLRQQLQRASARGDAAAVAEASQLLAVLGREEDVARLCGEAAHAKLISAVVAAVSGILGCKVAVEEGGGGWRWDEESAKRIAEAGKRVQVNAALVNFVSTPLGAVAKVLRASAVLTRSGGALAATQAFATAATRVANDLLCPVIQAALCSDALSACLSACEERAAREESGGEKRGEESVAGGEKAGEAGGERGGGEEEEETDVVATQVTALAMVTQRVHLFLEQLEKWTKHAEGRGGGGWGGGGGKGGGGDDGGGGVVRRGGFWRAGEECGAAYASCEVGVLRVGVARAVKLEEPSTELPVSSTLASDVLFVLQTCLHRAQSTKSHSAIAAVMRRAAAAAAMVGAELWERAQTAVGEDEFRLPSAAATTLGRQTPFAGVARRAKVVGTATHAGSLHSAASLLRDQDTSSTSTTTSTTPTPTHPTPTPSCPTPPRVVAEAMQRISKEWAALALAGNEAFSLSEGLRRVVREVGGGGGGGGGGGVGGIGGGGGGSGLVESAKEGLEEAREAVGAVAMACAGAVATALVLPRLRSALSVLAGASSTVRYDFGPDETEAAAASSAVFESDIVGRVDALLAPWCLCFCAPLAEMLVARAASFSARRLLAAVSRRRFSKLGAAAFRRDVRRITAVLHARGGLEAKEHMDAVALAATLLDAQSAEEARATYDAIAHRKGDAHAPLSPEMMGKVLARRIQW